MATRAGWLREQLLVAFHLYCRMPFGKMHRANPDVIRYAGLIGRTPSALAMKLTNIASLDPAITSTGRKGLEGASSADRAMWEEMQTDWEQFALAVQQAVERVEGQAIELPIAEDVHLGAAENYEGTERFATTKTRVGQAFFRDAVLSAYDYCCCISGLGVPQLLVASHIVPWRSDAKNRLNPRNGLCLSMLHDKAFDLGLICIADNFTVQISPKLMRLDDEFLTSSIIRYSGQRLRTPEKFIPDREFLAFHRDNVFVRT
ncbi:HNH endonuclease [Sulfuritalea sp.]|uniref:HNH endonuclease n=1 Tax=Sulfuritalea sp. TaxID=2480090 RepID=UPI001AC451CA|nr:HNH endonuclease [Sulfuritalea sp.]MBN8474640.1 HNH endonuclease [Sulfuritalea sp.]